jgi:hypothetical protein
VLILLHLCGAVMALWYAPQGFPFVHLKFYANTMLPWAGITIAVAAVGLVLARRHQPLILCVVAIASAWLGGGIVALICYRISLPWAPFGFVVVGGRLLLMRPSRCKMRNP